MATLVWDQVGERVFETGISKAVLYTSDGAFPWNGLTAIEETANDEIEPVYFDGVKVNDMVTLGDYSAQLKAFTYPDRFHACQGIIEDISGFYVADQYRERFGLSYQTRVGDDTNPEAGYKLHLAYNLIAIPSDRGFETISDTVDPLEFEWAISGIPMPMDGYRPTAHLIFDSRQIDKNMMSDLEEILYGSDVEEARLPTPRRIATFLAGWNRLIIIDHGDGTWTAEDNTGSYITMTGVDEFEITTDSADFVDADEYTISSTERSGAI